MTRKGILFIISGPSAVGKGTIKSALLRELIDINPSISVTTRKTRTGESSGKDYYYTSRKEFRQMIEEGRFLEWAEVYGNLYGTPLSFVEDNLTQGKDVLLEIDIQGALQVKQKMPGGVFIFIAPPNIETLNRRLLERGKDSRQSMEIRLAACRNEINHMRYYDYVVINDNLDQAVEKVQAIILAERCRLINYDLECDDFDSSVYQGFD